MQIDTTAGDASPVNGLPQVRATRSMAAIGLAERLPVIGLCILIGAAALFRAPILSDDRTWYDENAALLQGHGIYADAWPLAFQRAAVYTNPSLAGVLRDVRAGAYPPGFAVLVYLMSGHHNPVRQMRRMLFAAALGLLILTYRIAASLGDRWFALLATGYVASSTLLTHFSQQIKWNLIAAIAGLVSGWLLLNSRRSADQHIRWAYVFSLGVLLYIHYFCVWVLPAHLTFVLVADRPHLRRQLKESSVALGMAIPWYLFAFQTQLAFVQHHFDRLAHRTADAWNSPITALSAVRGLVYDLSVASGIAPLPIPARYLAPMIVIVVWSLFKAIRASNADRSRFALLAVVCAATAVAGQVVYAFKVGTIVPLQPSYFAAWVPMLMVAIVAGIDEIGRRGFRLATAGALVGVSVAAVLLSPVFDLIASSTAPADYRSVCARLTSPAPDTSIRYEDDIDAKVMNLMCPITGWQAVGADGVRLLPRNIQRIAVVEKSQVSVHARTSAR